MMKYNSLNSMLFEFPSPLVFPCLLFPSQAKLPHLSLIKNKQPFFFNGTNNQNILMAMNTF